MNSIILKRLQSQMQNPNVNGLNYKAVVDKEDLNAALRAWQDAEARAERNAKELAKVKHDARRP